MTLVTRCPSCGTAFRVQPAQLSARGGKVRCGKCGTVFNGVAALVEHAPAAPSAEPSPQLGLFEGARRPPAGEPRGPAPDPSRAAGAGVNTLLTEEAVLDRPPARPASAEAPLARPTRPEPSRSPVPPRAAPRSPVPQEPPPEFLSQPRPRARLTAVWILLSAAAVAALALQLALYWRSDIAARFPRARPTLATLCGALGCELHLPRRPDLMGIEASDLQADAQLDNVIVLNATIRNRAPFAQEFPSLELTLTDEQDRPVVRRVLAPKDYLAAAGERLRQGIAAGGEAVARVYFDTSRVRATGYRIYLFYP